jgi:zinc/manganese transport system substrate-binding protein
MTAALGFSMLNLQFQKAVMDGTDPAPRAVALMERDLTSRAVKILFYNRQASEPITLRMRQLADAHRIPIIGVSETEPAGMTFQRWQASQLAAVAQVL